MECYRERNVPRAGAPPPPLADLVGKTIVYGGKLDLTANWFQIVGKFINRIDMGGISKNL